MLCTICHVTHAHAISTVGRMKTDSATAAAALLLHKTQPTTEEPQPPAEDRHKRWLEQEVVRLTDRSQDLEEQLLEAQSAAMDMASRIEQLEVRCCVVL
jgi:hypothetical protein